MSEEEDKPGVSVDGKLVVTDLLGLGKAVEKLSPAASKLVEAIQAGAGKLYEPASLYLNARAENAANRHNALADAKAYLELETRSPVVLQSMRERILGVEYRRQENIHAAQVEAAQIAQANPSAEAHEIDPDFYVEWMEGVKDVSHEELRSAWARMLAEAPEREAGRVSKPILDFLRTLDAELAEELKWVYERRTPSTDMMPYAEANLSDMAAEIGIGSSVGLHAVSLFNGWLQFHFSPVAVSFFQLSTRAKELATIIFPPPANVEANAVAFLENLQSWLASLSYEAEEQDKIVLWVQVVKGYAKFNILPKAELMNNLDRRDALHLIDSLPSETPLEQALKVGMRKVAMTNYISVILD